MAALLLATLVTLLVVRGDDEGDTGGQLTAGTTTSSSSSTSTSSSSSTSTSVAPSTTTVTSTPTASTAPATTVVFPVVTGQGAILRPPPTTDLRTMQGDCRSLADEGWSATCGLVTAKDAQLVWLVETKDAPGGRTARRALVLRRAAASAWSVMLEARDDSGLRYDAINVRTIDLSGDGRDEVAFGFRESDRTLQVDVVEGPGTVVVHRGLSRGAARVSTGQLDVWRRVDASRYVHELIQVRDGAWRIVASSTVPASDVPPSQL